MPFYARKVDLTQADIVAALEKVGALVWIIGQPVDLLIYFRGQFSVMEVKTPRGKKYPKARIDKRQVAQNDFIARTGCPVVTSAMEALLALSVQHGICSGASTGERPHADRPVRPLPAR